MDRAVIEQFAAGGPQLAAVLAGLSEADLDARPGPGAWSLRELAVHLYDSDMVGGDRLRRIAAMDRPLLMGYDESAFVKNLNYGQLDAQLAARMFADGRTMVAAVLRGLPDNAFDRVGIHSEDGAVPLGKMVQKYIAHLEYHLDFARRKRERLGKPPA